jgi:hypothetical protein
LTSVDIAPEMGQSDRTRLADPQDMSARHEHARDRNER